MSYIIPLLIVLLFIYSSVKKINTYEVFIEGSKKSLELCVNIFAFLVAIFICIELFNSSGLSEYFVKLLEPLFVFLGIPKELISLVIIKPFSGSGSLSVLTDIYSKYGVDSYIGKCASCIVGSSETVFYVSSVYFSKTSIKKIGYALILGTFATILSCILSCLLCKIF